jgi:hypothetical protein
MGMKSALLEKELGLTECRNMPPEDLVDFQGKRASVRRVIKSVKRNAWRHFCSTIGSATELGDVRSMLKNMIGISKSTRNQVLDCQ